MPNIRKEYSMARAKKDGKNICYYVDRELVEKLQEYAEERGQTNTMALERILRKFFSELENKADPIE